MFGFSVKVKVDGIRGLNPDQIFPEGFLLSLLCRGARGSREYLMQMFQALGRSVAIVLVSRAVGPHGILMSSGRLGTTVTRRGVRPKIQRWCLWGGGWVA